MSERSGTPVIPLPRGVKWVSRKEGENAKSFAEFAVKTPRFPDYVTTSELRFSSQAIQVETALSWFLSNLEPYSASATNLGIGSRPIGEQPNYPAALLSHTALLDAFGAALTMETLKQIAAYLPGSWMWREDPPPLDNLPAILARLDALAEEVRQLATAHGQKGHNSGAWFPEEAQREALKVIAETKQAVRANAEDRTPISEDTKSRFRHVVGAIGACLLAASLIVGAPIFDGAMKENGKLLQHSAVAWSTGNSLSEVLANWH
ncbi:MAG: hypothetical protein ACRYG6_08290 [Janthinobacterium lividum]